MSVRRLGSAGRVALGALVGTIALWGACAGAQARVVPVGSFGSGEHPSIERPIGVAVDQSSGNVFVASLTSDRLNEFDASGKLISPPSPFGEEGLYSGVAVDPINGDVYAIRNFYNEVSEKPETKVETYNPGTGAFESSFPVSGCGNYFKTYTMVQIAVDSAGNVYVPCEPESAVREYSPTGALLKTIKGSGLSALSGPTGVAVDSFGNVWVADDGNNRIEEFDSTGATVLAAIASPGVESVAVDAAAGHVFALLHNSADGCGILEAPCYHLVEYSLTGTQLGDIGAGEIGQSLSYTRGGAAKESGAIDTLAVDESSGDVYVTDGGYGVVRVYAPTVPPVLVEDKELAVEVTSTEAKLGALINSGGEDTTFLFEYGTTTAYGQITPFPAGDAGAGLKPTTVWASASGLAPGTTYHYRVVASSPLGTIEGPDRTFTTATTAQAACPNEALRTGFSASLPDCRAYEQVTTPSTDPAVVDPRPEQGKSPSGENFASREGERFAYWAIDVLPGSQTPGFDYLATRGPGGWYSENEIPPQAGYYGEECPLYGSFIEGYSADMSKAVLMDGAGQQEEYASGGAYSSECSGPTSELASGEPQGFENLFVHGAGGGSYQLVDATPPGVQPNNARFFGGSEDLSRVVFSERARLTAGAPEGFEDLYEWSGGVVRLVTVLPSGAPVAGSLAAGGAGLQLGAANTSANAYVISKDGSRVFFTAGGSLYVRENAEQAPSEECATPASACTVQVDASQTGGTGGGGKFMDASAGGSKVFFLDANRLTSDATAASGKPDLYEYDLGNGQLSDLSVDGAEPANVQGVSGTSEDGSYVYFAANGVLAGNENAHKEKAHASRPNLYVLHEGQTTFIATTESSCAWESCRRVSANGEYFAFVSQESLTGYDNVDTGNGIHDNEIFLYSAAANTLACASCDPSGQAPASGGATMELRANAAPHYLAGSGRLFFETSEALLPRDTNGQMDVYEFEPDGVGSCGEAGGCLYLISSGTSPKESELLDASESGGDVFLRQFQQLTPQDTQEEAVNIVDARVQGGFAVPVAPPPCVTADACRSAAAAQPSLYGAPSSETFSGVGNLAPPVEAKAKPNTKKAKSKVCKHVKGKRARCASQAHRARAKAKSHKGGKRS